MADFEEEAMIRVAALRNLALILEARSRAEDDLLQARDELERKTNELLQLNNELEERVCARTAELTMARKFEEIASKGKSAILATMSREVSEIVGVVDALSRTSLGADQMEMVGRIHNSALSLLQVGTAIADFSDA